MPKRKQELSARNAHITTLSQTQLEAALEHGKKSLFKALKLARGFERQKLGRRQKSAQENKDSTALPRLAAEVNALKGLDLFNVAELHLYKTMLKTRSIAQSTKLPECVERAVKSARTGDSASTNVTARLFNSNAVSIVLEEVLTTVRILLGVSESQGPRKKRLRAADFKKSEVESIEKHAACSAASTIRKEATARKLNSRETGSWDGFDDSDVPSKPSDDTESGGDSDMVRYSARIANGSSDESFTDDTDAIDRRANQRESSFSPIRDPSQRSKPRASSFSPIRSPNKPPNLRDSSSSPSPPPSPQNHPIISANTRPQPDATISAHTRHPRPSPPPPKPSTTSTTFLPTLMSGYVSGSDASLSDGENDEAAVAELAPRKNRRGQQARRLLWEKKFGANAKHLQGQSRDQGWDAKRGAQGGDERGRRGQGRGRGVGGGGGRGRTARQSGANTDPVKGRRGKGEQEEEDTGPLHPSWEAKKRAKEKGMGTAFEGKKITFD